MTKLYKDSDKIKRMAGKLRAQRARVLKLKEGPPELTNKELSEKTLIGQAYLSVLLRRAIKEREEDDKTK